MKKILVTGGTVFVSKYIAEYFVKEGNTVYVLNRNNHPQPQGTILIEGDRKNLGNILKEYSFDVVMDINSYNAEDISLLLEGLGEFKDYIFISSSAVYPETLEQPFNEDQPVGENKYWTKYGTDKIEAEKLLLEKVPNAYILRPPYLYGPMNNAYREAFVFDCALENRKFYLPKEGSMRLQFFHIDDLARFIDIILKEKPKNHIFNVGNKEIVTIKEWVELCYGILGKEPNFVEVDSRIDQRNYFSFYDYEYILDVKKQNSLINNLIPLEVGLKQAYDWYVDNKHNVNRKNFIEYIDKNI